MEFDDSECRCPDLVGIARDVFGKIPIEDRTWIEKVCDRVIFLPGTDCEAEYIHRREIRVYVPRMNDYSDDGKRGILAHEFGHACALSKLGYAKSGPTAEAMADMFARQWRFGYAVDERNRGTEQLREKGR